MGVAAYDHKPFGRGGKGEKRKGRKEGRGTREKAKRERGGEKGKQGTVENGRSQR